MVSGRMPEKVSSPSNQSRRVSVDISATTATGATGARTTVVANVVTSATISRTSAATKTLYCSRVSKLVRTRNVQAAEPGKNRPSG